MPASIIIRQTVRQLAQLLKRGGPRPALGVLLALLPACLPGALGQTITPVPVFPGGSGSPVYGVNANGTAAAGYSTNSASVDSALRFTNPGGTTNLGLLPGGVFNSYAQAIDSTGTILAGYGDSGGNSRAFRWTNTGGYQILPLVPGTGNFATAKGISANGARVVGTSGLNTAARAFLWDSASPTVSSNLGVLPGQSSSGAAAISGNGLVIVGSSGSQPFRWTSSGGMQGLGAPLPGQTSALAEAVNTDGSVITGRYIAGSELGYRWTSGSGMVALPQSPGGSSALRPRAINGNGTVIIGQVVDNVAGFTAFIWTPSLGTQLLPAHLAARGVNMAGWQLTDATGISADGTAMCGIGYFNGVPQGWVIKDLPCVTFSGFGFQGPTCVGTSGWVMGGSPSGNTTGAIFRWEKNGLPLSNGLQPTGSSITGATTSQIVFSNIQAADAGSYTCYVTSQGACESSFTIPNFPGAQNAVTVTVQPSANTACQGQNPSLFCAATTSNLTSVLYRWQKFVSGNWVDLADGATGNGGSFFGTGTTTFSILNAQVADTGQYRCRLTNSQCVGVSTQYSNAVPFTIVGSPTVTGPGDSYQCTGDNDAFMGVTVSPAVPHTGSYSYRWQKYVGPSINSYVDIFDGPTGNGGSYGQTNTAVLGVYSFSPAEANYFRCRVTGPCGAATISAPGYLGAIPPAAILSNPVTVAQCPGDNDVFFSVTATPGVSYRWQKSTTPFSNTFVNIFDGPTGNGGNYGQTGTAMMGVYGLGAGDYTKYRCVVTDPCFFNTAASAPASLVTLGAPPIGTQPTGSTVSVGGTASVSFTLAPSGNSSISYQWWRYVPAFPIYVPLSNGTLPSGAIVGGAQSPTLTISNFQAQDAGQYYCMVAGDCNSGPTNVVTLTLGPGCSIADIAPPGGDGTVDGGDFVAFINSFAIGDVNIDPTADIAGAGPLGLSPDGTIDGTDFVAFINAFALGC